MRMNKLEAHASTQVTITNIIERKESESQMITYNVVPLKVQKPVKLDKGLNCSGTHSKLGKRKVRKQVTQDSK